MPLEEQADQYIVDLSEVTSLVGTESVPVQHASGGPGSTVRITSENLRKFSRTEDVTELLTDGDIAITDRSKLLVYFNDSSPPIGNITLTLDVDIPVGFRVDVLQAGTGTVTVQASSSPPDDTLVGDTATTSAGDRLTLVKLRDTIWIGSL